MDRQSVVRDLDLLSAVTLAVPIVAEKQGGPRQAVKLSYTDDFDFVQGVLRGLLTVSQKMSTVPDINNVTAPTTSSTSSTSSSSQLTIMERPEFICDISGESTRRGTGMPSEDWAPLYLITQGSVIDKCGAHYGAWKLRRDIITSPELFEQCAFESAKFPVPVESFPQEWKARYEQENIPQSQSTTTATTNLIRDFIWSDVNEFSKSSTEPSSKAHHKHPSPSDVNNEESDASSFETIDSADEELWAELQRERCASLRVILPSIVGGDFTSDGGYCVWRAVAWELDQCKAFARRNHKNFQVWHHRRELIAYGLAKSGNTPFTDILSFDQIDERILCDKVLEDDSKNYHVWSHRCWFVSAFPELNTIDVPAMVKQSSKNNNVNAAGSTHHQNTTESDDELLNEIRARNEAKVVEPYSLPVSSGASVIGGLEQEFNYSSKLIHNDVFNNSAWSYRMLLLRQFVVERGFVSTIKKKATPQHGASDDEVLNVCNTLFNDVLIAEIQYAVYWASVEVCNECPFTYARGVAALASDAIQAILGASTSTPSTTLVESIVNLYIRLFDNNNTTPATDDNEVHSTTTTTKRLLSSMPHMYVHSHLSTRILTKALLVSEQVKDSTTPYGKRTAFVRNNTHQCIAGMYHSAFDYHAAYWGSLQRQQHNDVRSSTVIMKSLKSALSAANMAPLLSDPVLTGVWTLDSIPTWGSQFTDHLRKVAEGITHDVLADIETSSAAATADDDNSSLLPPNADDMVSWIYAHVTCLALGRLLTREDSIRYKYWKAQIHDLLHFRMLV